MVKISVVIATINNPIQLRKCVDSILRNKYRNFEIIIVDQSDIINLDFKKKESGSPQIRYFNVKWKGKARALNIGIRKSVGNIVAFTDHDCLVSRRWLQDIEDFFDKNEDTPFLIGHVLPYRSSVENGYKVIMPDYKLINYTKRDIIFDKLSYGMTVVSGNNMAVKKSLFSRIGFYKNWLGPGARCFAGEDTEIAMRAISEGCKIGYSPKIKVYHDGYTKIRDFQKKEFLYFCGYVSVFIYYLVLGNKVVLKYLNKLFAIKFGEWKKNISISLIGFHPRNLIFLLVHIIYELLFILRAIILPIVYFIVEK